MKKIIYILFAVFVFGTPVFAQDKKPVEPTAEQRQKMADVHENLAKCLRSDRPIAECRQEARKSCQEMMKGKEGCMMMDGDMMGGNKMMDGGMMTPKEQKSEEGKE